MAPVAAEEPEAPAGPRTWAEAREAYATSCPGPFFTLPAQEERIIGGHSFLLHGSTLVRAGGAWRGPLRLGVLGSLKDADDETRRNLQRARKAFDRAGVQFVVVNGDLVVDEGADLDAVVRMLGAVFQVPVFAHAGNSEWTSAFQGAFAAHEGDLPHLVNMNLVRHVDLGGVHLFSLPGWSNRKFLRSGACAYGTDHLEALQAETRKAAAAGGVVVLSAHGPPRGEGPRALDYAHEGGNVGDEHVRALLIEGSVRFGLFSHILEAGGRATADPQAHSPLVGGGSSERLYVNVGSASAFPWGMLDGSTARGMGAIVELSDLESGGKAKVEFLRFP